MDTTQVPVSVGPYRIDTPVRNLHEVNAELFNMIFFGKDDLKSKVLLLNSGSYLAQSEKEYDCLNWSLGFRLPQVKTSDHLRDVTVLYGSYGFTPLQGDITPAHICLFTTRLNQVVHAHVKQSITINGQETSLWTSKLGSLPYLLAYPDPVDLKPFYATHNARNLVYFKKEH